jgi:NADPH:quinone reductase-like Zn-dependent oxidoreductase
MRAAAVRSVGGPDHVEVLDVDLPVPGLAQVRIKVKAASLNPVDAAVWAGLLGQPAVGEQLGLGWDVAGVVDAVGQMAAITVGTKVIAMLQGPVVSLGTQADYVVVNASAVAPAPAGIAAPEAATIPLNGLTAAQSLELTGLRPGNTVLVTGAAGAVGGYAVEIGKHLGLYVVAIAGADDEQLLTTVFGADLFVARSDEPVVDVRRRSLYRVDAVVDAASLGRDIIGAVRDGGTYVRVDPHGGTLPPAQRGIRMRTTLAVPDGSRLTTLSDLAASGRLTPRVAHTYPLAQAGEAHARLAQGGLRGRIVLVP